VIPRADQNVLCNIILQAGVNVKVAQALAGHSAAFTLDVYVFVI
jgi:site-specific recombinase XerD